MISKGKGIPVHLLVHCSATDLFNIAINLLINTDNVYV